MEGGLKIIVTGAAGFIGSNLAESLLAAGHEVVGVDNLTAGTKENVPRGVSLRVDDIRSDRIGKHFEGADAVFHLAAKNCLVDCLHDPVETADINVRGTANVLEAARRAGAQKFVYADSSAEYEGESRLPSVVDRIAPQGPYAVSKRGGALFCESYRKNFGMNITILRYFNVYGPAQDFRRVIPPVMSAFIMKMLKGEPPVIYGTGGKRRDFIYVDDVNRFHLLVLKNSRTNGQTYNVGTGVSFSVNEIFQLIEETLKTKLRPVHQPELPNDTDATLADISQSQALGWEPKIDIREGLKKTIEYLKGRMGLQNRRRAGSRRAVRR